jgi:hypothetical protein
MERGVQRITLRNLRLVDRFIDLELHILLDLTIKHSRKRWIACSDGVSAVWEPVILHDAIIIDSEEHSMLVNVVQFVNLPKKIVAIFIRLEPVDSFDSFGPHALYFSSLLNFVSISILGDREFGATCRCISCNSDKMVCEVVECSPEILDNISRSTHDIKIQDSSVLERVDRLHCSG